MAYRRLRCEASNPRNRLFELPTRWRNSCPHNKKALRRSRRRAFCLVESGRRDLNPRSLAPPITTNDRPRLGHSAILARRAATNVQWFPFLHVMPAIGFALLVFPLEIRENCDVLSPVPCLTHGNGPAGLGCRIRRNRGLADGADRQSAREMGEEDGHLVLARRAGAVRPQLWPGMLARGLPHGPKEGRFGALQSADRACRIARGVPLAV